MGTCRPHRLSVTAFPLSQFPVTRLTPTSPSSPPLLLPIHCDLIASPITTTTTTTTILTMSRMHFYQSSPNISMLLCPSSSSVSPPLTASSLNPLHVSLRSLLPSFPPEQNVSLKNSSLVLRLVTLRSLPLDTASSSIR